MSLNLNGWREIDFKLDDGAIQKIGTNLLHQMRWGITPIRATTGKGIVFCAGGLSYFSCVWISINRLRKIGCRLPIEVWFLGTELSENIILKLIELDVECCNFLDHEEYHKNNLDGFGLKPLAIILSKFEEVLYLDADNLCVIDPSYLFDDVKYLETGTIFWPDMWRTSPENPIWQIINSDAYSENEQESGQLLVNKSTCWEELQICLYLNIQRNVYYRFLYGDKDTFKFAWQAKRKKYYMIDGFPGICGYRKNGNFLGNTLVQFSPSTQPLFFHRNLLKWDVTLSNEKAWSKIKIFRTVSAKSKFIFSFSSESHFYLDIVGDVEETSVDQLIREVESECLETLNDLRKEKFYLDFVHHLHLKNNRFKNNKYFKW